MSADGRVALPDTWQDDRDHLRILTAWLAARGHSAKTVAEAVEEPREFEDELRTALAVGVHEYDTEHHVNVHNDTSVYCNDCDWEFDGRVCRQRVPATGQPCGEPVAAMGMCREHFADAADQDRGNRIRDERKEHAG